MSLPHGTPVLVPRITEASARPSTDTPTYENKAPWLALRETLSFDTLRKKTTTTTSSSTWTLPLHRKTTANTGSEKEKKKKGKKSWTPPALRPFTLILAILISLGLIISLQLLLLRSNRNQGVIFAADINALPLSRTFVYQYFPTIIAVFYSIFWSWIDLEAKRVEPWFRLSRKEGSKGKDSLLLAYPFDFVPLVPFKAGRKGHWPVFWASLALVLVAWGLVPVQAGIFSVHRITVNTTTSFNISTHFMPADRQEKDLSMRFAQSTYGIATLNETLPPYMTRNYTLAPFLPSTPDANASSEAGEWTAPTTMYSLNLYCEPAIALPDFSSAWNSSWGCFLSAGLWGNNTIAGDESTSASGVIKRFTGLFAGHAMKNVASYYIYYCPPERTHTFYAAFTENKQRDEDPPNHVTSIFCEPMYYEQDVNATVDRITREPKKVVPLGPRRELPENVFNKTLLEVLLADTVHPGAARRGDFLPIQGIPKYIESRADTDLSIGDDSLAMVGLASSVGGRPLQDYLDWKALSASYAKAYRLLFARAMVDVLGSEKGDSKQASGNQVVFLDAVYLEPVFTYIVIGLLAAVAICAAVLLYLSMTRTTALLSDPNTIASIMSLAADNSSLLADFKDLDCCTAKELQESIRDKEYKLSGDTDQINITSTNHSLTAGNALPTRQRTVSSKVISKPIRPVEFSLWASIPFVGLFAVLATALSVLFVKASSNGLPLPSKNKIVQNILENYIPTALATLIEPMWVLMNRLLCLLQPIEQLKKGNARSKKSIELDYTSLPPQLVIWKALRARHIVLTTVCAMTLLTNLLAVSFAGLFYHKTVEIQIPMAFQQPLEPRFVSINGSIGPKPRGSELASGAYRGGDGEDQFLVAESNYTRGTPLPAWTDDKLFYMPFLSPTSSNGTVQSQYEASTVAFGAELECSELKPSSFSGVEVDYEGYKRKVLSVLLEKDGASATCISTTKFRLDAGPDSAQNPIEWIPVCQQGPAAAELVYTLEPAGNVNGSKADRNLCGAVVVLGWARDREGTCGETQEKALDAKNSFFVQCSPRLVKGRGTLRVDSEGRLLRTVNNRVIERDIDANELNTTFSNDPINIISQSNQYLFQSFAKFWHNDTFATDFINYFTGRADSNRLLDPKKGLPTLEDVQVPLGKAYSSLFAIWLGTNKEKLFVHPSDVTPASSSGWRVEKEERLFLTTALFAIAQGILSIYAMVAILVYLRRPGAYLPRLPTSTASIIGLFAASAAVQDMRGTSKYEAKERARHLRSLGVRYGYGNFVGTDGSIHVGIEKTPFVRPRVSTERNRSVLAFRKATTA
ncbi:hypothetical protein CC80DRAFT_128575 [Byssothecium circinans]|uniref:Uncharacterized protein n=1 Tax=Byssothecium circinans TaxID=147558 RepID=A0A6A5TR52_9PLEO|nr:hypothetical protein CC80DRAFT_128575 [Byssothecium circinans]